MKNIFAADVELLIVLGRGYIMIRKQDSKTNKQQTQTLLLAPDTSSTCSQLNLQHIVALTKDFSSRLSSWWCRPSLWIKASAKWNWRVLDYSVPSAAMAENHSVFPTLRNSMQRHVSVSNRTWFDLFECLTLFLTLVFRSHICATWKRGGKKNQLNQPTGSLEPCDVVLAYMSLVQPASTHPVGHKHNCLFGFFVCSL